MVLYQELCLIPQNSGISRYIYIYRTTSVTRSPTKSSGKSHPKSPPGELPNLHPFAGEHDEAHHEDGIFESRTLFFGMGVLFLFERGSQVTRLSFGLRSVKHRHIYRSCCFFSVYEIKIIFRLFLW